MAAATMKSSVGRMTAINMDKRSERTVSCADAVSVAAAVAAAASSRPCPLKNATRNAAGMKVANSSQPKAAASVGDVQGANSHSAHARAVTAPVVIPEKNATIATA